MCYGTIRYLSGCYSAVCAVCRSVVCINCKAIHDKIFCNTDTNCSFSGALKVKTPDRLMNLEEQNLMTAEELFDALKEGNFSGSQETNGDDKKENVEKLENEKTLKDQVLDEVLNFEESTKSEEKNDSCSTPTLSLGDSSSKLKRKRLFTGVDAGPGNKKFAMNVSASDSSGSEAEKTIDQWSTNISNFTDEAQDEEANMSKSFKLDVTYEEFDDNGKTSYHCRACSYVSKAKTIFSRHLKTKKHFNNSANFEASPGSTSATE